MLSTFEFSMSLSPVPAEALETYEPEMTDEQRKCLLHIFRNSAAALEGLVMLLERRDCSPTTSELDGCIRGVVRSLVQTKGALAGGTFCALNQEECAFVGPFVGCAGHPIAGAHANAAITVPLAQRPRDRTGT